MYELIIGGSAGFLGGLLSVLIAKSQILKRVDDKQTAEKVNNSVVMVSFALIAAVVCAFIFYSGYYPIQTCITGVITVIAAMSIAVVDWTIRKIPNESLFLLLVVKAVDIVVSVIQGASWDKAIITPIITCVLCFIVFSIPSFFGIPIGAGDIKYCAVIGFLFGIWGFFEAVSVMGVTMLIYYIYLKIRKKGNIKSSVPMGPFLSLGVLVTLVVPVEIVLGIV